MLAEDNMFSNANDFIRGKQTDLDKSKIKALYIEGMINFLEIYAQSEIGEVEVNIPAVSLYVNSPEFENVDCFEIKNIEDVYKCLEIETLIGLPIWRFLKLSEYQMNLFEKNYEQILIDRQKYLEKNYPCKRCVFFEEFSCNFGYISNCKYRKDAFDISRDKHIDWTKINTCENCITINDNIDYLKNDKPYTWRETKSAQESLKRKLEKRKIQDLDKYKITLKDLKKDCVDLNIAKNVDRTNLVLADFADALSNKRSKSERRKELKKALYLESFIKFIDLYIKNEIGSGDIDIVSVVLYLEDKELEFNSEKELFEELENMILNGFSLKEFIKK